MTSVTNAIQIKRRTSLLNLEIDETDESISNDPFFRSPNARWRISIDFLSTEVEQIHFREANDIKHLKTFIVSEGREILENCHTALGQGYRHLTSVHANLSRLFHEACKISN